jgi:hypothetical protein
MSRLGKTYRSSEHRMTDIRTALAELVALKDLKDEESRLRQRRECSILRQPNKLATANAMRDDYNIRKPKAWAAARAALAAPPAARIAPGVVHVCVNRDALCGDNPANWCDTCPMRDALAAPPAAPAEPAALSDEEMADCGLLSELAPEPAALSDEDIERVIAVWWRDDLKMKYAELCRAIERIVIERMRGGRVREA